MCGLQLPNIIGNHFACLLYVFCYTNKCKAVVMTNKYIVLLGLVSLVITGCGEGGGDAGSGSGSNSAQATIAVVAPTVYTFEFSGNGVTFSMDLHGYAVRNYGGSQANPSYPGITLGAATQVIPITAESFIANITLNTGAGMLTIVTKKNGNIIRTDTINTNATGISTTDAN